MDGEVPICAAENGGKAGQDGPIMFFAAEEAVNPGVSRFGSIEIKDLPPKKRLPAEVAAGNAELSVCAICGLLFAGARALSCHMGHHTRWARESRRRVGIASARLCQRCGKSFSSSQVLGSHSLDCRMRSVRVHRRFDLNQAPWS